METKIAMRLFRVDVLDLTQNKIDELCDFAEGTWAQYEGGREPGITALKKIGEVFDILIDDLLKGQVKKSFQYVSSCSSDFDWLGTEVFSLSYRVFEIHFKNWEHKKLLKCMLLGFDKGIEHG